MDGDKSFMVGLSVLCATPEEVVRATEILARPMVGLALDNLHASLSVTPVSNDELENPL